MSRTKRTAPVLYFHPDDPAGWIKPDEPFIVDGLDWSWAFVVYRDIEGFPGYRIGSNGLLWSCLKVANSADGPGFKSIMGTEWIWKKPSFNSKLKYLVTSILRGGITRNCRIHKIVIEAFVGPCPPGKECLHRDDDGTNNRLSNLRYGTHVENYADAVKNGRLGPGELNGRAKVTEADVIAMRQDYAAGGVILAQLAARYHMTIANVCDIVTGKTWYHVGGPISKPESRRCKLTPETVALAREWVADGIPQAEVARRLGVHKNAINRLIRGHSWAKKPVR
jgi:hypothetical protein